MPPRPFQARQRWGPEADGWFSLFGASVVLAGVADQSTLRMLNALGGDHEVATTTLSQWIGRRGRLRPSSSVSTVRLPRHAVDVISRGTPGRALVLNAHSAMAAITLTPAHQCGPWRDFLPDTHGREPRAAPEPWHRTR